MPLSSYYADDDFTPTPAKRDTYRKTCNCCKRPLMDIFYTAVCDFCEKPAKGTFYRGFVVWNKELNSRAGNRHTYVWRTLNDAEGWRVYQGIDASFETRLVLSPKPITWRFTYSNLMASDRPLEIHEDHKFAPDFGHAFFAPDGGNIIVSDYFETVNL